MMKYVLIISALVVSNSGLFDQYDSKYVETSTVADKVDSYSLIKMSRKDDRVKVKYFAAKDFNGSSVVQRYKQWSKNKNIIAYSSGTYMTSCDANLAKPVGICIDNGVVVNNSISDNLDGLGIVYQTGGMVASNIKEGNLTVKKNDGSSLKIDLRNAFQRSQFIDWAKENNATVFQTHLFYYNNIIQVFPNGNKEKRERRFLAVAKDQNGIVCHYIVNIKSKNNSGYTIYDATVKVTNFLKKYEDVSNIVFLINLDPGCQDVFEVKTEKGLVDQRPGFKGTVPIENSANLIVYYFE